MRIDRYGNAAVGISLTAHHNSGFCVCRVNRNQIINQALLSSDIEAARSEATNQSGAATVPPAPDVSGLRLYARTDVAEPFLDGPLGLETVVPANEAVTNVLRVWPLAGFYWLRLAEIRAASGKDIQSVNAAYQLSVVVAPFDGEMMLARQVLGVQLWVCTFRPMNKGASSTIW